MKSIECDFDGMTEIDLKVKNCIFDKLTKLWTPNIIL